MSDEAEILERRLTARIDNNAINQPIITVDDPLTSVVLGVGKILDELDLLRKVSVMSQYSSTR